MATEYDMNDFIRDIVSRRIPPTTGSSAFPQTVFSTQSQINTADVNPVGAGEAGVNSTEPTRDVYSVGGPGIYIERIGVGQTYKGMDENGIETEKTAFPPFHYHIHLPDLPEDSDYVTYVLGVVGKKVQWIATEECPDSGSGEDSGGSGSGSE